jgi:hypothetical protein
MGRRRSFVSNDNVRPRNTLRLAMIDRGSLISIPATGARRGMPAEPNRELSSD